MANELDSILRRYTPNLITDPEAARANKLAEIEATYKANPNRAIESAGVFESLPLENVKSNVPNLVTDPEAVRAARLAEIKATYEANPNRAIESAGVFESLPLESSKSNTPKLITDPETIRANRLAEIEATYRANPNRAIESAGVLESLAPEAPNFELVGNPNPTQRPNFKLQGKSYSPELLPATIEAPVPTVRANAELPAVRLNAELPSVKPNANLPDVLVRGYSTETPMSRLMGRYPNAAMGVAGIAAAGLDRYLKTKDTNEPFFNPQASVDEREQLYNDIMDYKKNMTPKGGGRMPSKNDMAPFSDKVDLSSYFKNYDADNSTNMNAKLIADQKEDTVSESKIKPEQKQQIKNDPTKAKNEAIDKINEADQIIASKDTTDKEYEDAIKQRNMNQFIATMAQAAERIGYSMAGANAQVLKPDLSFTNKMMEQAGQPLVDLKEKRKSKLEKMELEKEQAKSDPNSSISKLYRDALAQISPEMASKVSSMSASEVEKAFPTISAAVNAVEARKSREFVASQNAANRQLQRDMMSQEKEQRQQASFQQKFNDSLNKLSKEKADSQGNMDTAYGLADAAVKSPSAATSLAKAVVKAVEGAGARVSDKDVQNALGDAGISGELTAYIQNRASGTIPKYKAEDIKKMLDVMRTIHDKKFNERSLEMVHRQARLSGKSEEDIIAESFLPGREPTRLSQQQNTQMKDPQIEAYAKQHGMSYENANSLIQARKAKMSK